MFWHRKMIRSMLEDASVIPLKGDFVRENKRREDITTLEYYAHIYPFFAEVNQAKQDDALLHHDDECDACDKTSQECAAH